MATRSSSPSTVNKPVGASSSVAPIGLGARVAVLTGGFDRPYVFGLTMALASKGVSLDVIGSDDVDVEEMHNMPQIAFLNLRGSKEEAGIASKVTRVLLYYARLLRYAAVAEPKIFHILWNNKFEHFDRTLLMLYYKFLGKQIVFTAHNVNAGKRDSNDSLLNRLTLRIQYLLADHIFVHTEQMKSELQRDFGIRRDAITVIPFGINNSVPDTDLTPAAAKQMLGIGDDEKTILFFGAIRPYKGLEYLVEAFLQLAARHPEYRLVIAGEPRKESEKYLEKIRRRIDCDPSQGRVISRLRYILDSETELYFKAADVLALPYTHVFQSGVLFLAYNFGLPVVATDVGSVREEIIEDRTGFLCRPCDPIDMAKALETYFGSDLFKSLDTRRHEIRHYAKERHSWDTVGEMTLNVYVELGGKLNGPQTSSDSAL